MTPYALFGATATCPAGTYGDGVSTCTTCDQGSYCAGGSSTVQCAADTYNPVYGASVIASCKSCATDFGPTYGSDAGSGSCSAGSHHIDCSLPANGGAGFYWDGDAAACVQCDAGTWLDTTQNPPVCSAW